MLCNEIVLNKKIRDREIIFIKEMRKNPGYKGFAIGDFVNFDSKYASDFKV